MSTQYIHVVAVSQDNAIGQNNTIPWVSMEDMRWFKRITTGHIIVMGRKTYDSLPAVLKDRWIVVLTNEKSDIAYRDKEPKGESVVFTDNMVSGVIKLMQGGNKPDVAIKTDKVYIVGGAEIYKHTNDMISGALVSLIDVYVPDADTHYTLHKEGMVPVETVYTSQDPDDPLVNVMSYAISKVTSLDNQYAGGSNTFTHHTQPLPVEHDEPTGSPVETYTSSNDKVDNSSDQSASDNTTEDNNQE